MPLVQLLRSNGSYDRMKNGWQEQCEAAGEPFHDYARGTFLVLDELAGAPEYRAGVFGVQHGDDLPEIICQVNCTPLPGHPEPVLRVRMVTMSPELDFGTAPGDPAARYVQNLVDLFFGIVELSQGPKAEEMQAKDIKFHLRSPQDYAFFQAVRPELAKISHFESVEMKGAWLYITRAL
jgi:hypothetical protein